MSEPDETPRPPGTERQSPSDVARMLGARRDAPTGEFGASSDPWENHPIPETSEPVPARIGRFQVKGELGGGTFGRVFLADDPELVRQVAIKVPQGEGLSDKYRKRFLHEARATAAIHHPNVCPVYDVGTDGTMPYIVMRFVAGGALSKILRSGCFIAPTAVAVARKLADGLAAAHEKGVVHRDLKPANVLYDGKEMLIADFGLAHVGRDATMSSPGAGTPLYMSPEQAREQANQIGPCSDIYSLGVILYEMLTGQVPFTGASRLDIMVAHCERLPQPPSQVRSHLDSRLNALCLKALAKDPKDRYPTAHEFSVALGDYLDKLDTTKARKPLPDMEPVDQQPRTGTWWKRWLWIGEQQTQPAQADYVRGRQHYEGKGVPQDSRRAAELFERAARLGFAPAQCCLGCLCTWGEGLPQDHAKARVWFERAAEQGNAEAQYRLGLLCYSGLGGPQDQTVARKWWQKASEQGHADASNRLGAIVAWWN